LPYKCWPSQPFYVLPVPALPVDGTIFSDRMVHRLRKWHKVRNRNSNSNFEIESRIRTSKSKFEFLNQCLPFNLLQVDRNFTFPSRKFIYNLIYCHAAARWSCALSMACIDTDEVWTLIEDETETKTIAHCFRSRRP
jgi:hypothetical protein